MRNGMVSCMARVSGKTAWRGFPDLAREPGGQMDRYLVVADADATHNHLPPILVQESTHRSLVSTALPAPSVPLPVHAPVTTAVSPCATTFMSLSSFVTHLPLFVRSMVSA